MQFHLGTDELNLLADVLLEQDSRKHGELLNKIAAHDLSLDADQFLEAAELLSDQRGGLVNEISRLRDPALKADLQRKLATLDRVLDKVNECCVMF